MSTQQSMFSLRCINGKEVLRVRNIKGLSTAGLLGLFTQHLPLEAADVCVKAKSHLQTLASQ